MNLIAQSLLLFSLFFQFSFLSSCGKTLTERQENVAPIDTSQLVAVDTSDVKLIESLTLSDDPSLTHFILVRHAEKLTNESNPKLSDKGKKRANKLAVILSELKINRIYSTQYHRTLETATPTAQDQGIEISNYDGFDQAKVATHIFETINGGTVLIVGHSNTIPEFMNALTGTQDYQHIEGDVYDNLFVVSIKSQDDLEVIHLKY